MQTPACLDACARAPLGQSRDCLASTGPAAGACLCTAVGNSPKLEATPHPNKQPAATGRTWLTGQLGTPGAWVRAAAGSLQGRQQDYGGARRKQDRLRPRSKLADGKHDRRGAAAALRARHVGSMKACNRLRLTVLRQAPPAHGAYAARGGGQAGEHDTQAMQAEDARQVGADVLLEWTHQKDDAGEQYDDKTGDGDSAETDGEKHSAWCGSAIALI